MEVIFAYEDGQTDVIELNRLSRYIKNMYSYGGEEYVTAYYNEFGKLPYLTVDCLFSVFDANDFATVSFVFGKPNGDSWAYGSYTVDGRS